MAIVALEPLATRDPVSAATLVAAYELRARARFGTGFLTDTWAVAGEGPGYTFESTNPAARVDYVFTSDAVPPVQGRVVSTDPVASDHLPVAVHVPITSQDPTRSARSVPRTARKQ